MYVIQLFQPGLQFFFVMIATKIAISTISTKITMFYYNNVY